MADVLGDLSRAVFGDPNTEGLQSRVGSYEELHAEAQSILVPPVYPAGLTVQLLQSLNKNFGITHRCGDSWGGRSAGVLLCVMMQRQQPGDRCPCSVLRTADPFARLRVNTRPTALQVSIRAGAAAAGLCAASQHGRRAAAAGQAVVRPRCRGNAQVPRGACGWGLTMRRRHAW
jgi:hypothetical protein